MTGEWQDIATAPRDGTGMLLTDGRWVHYGWYSDRDTIYPWVFVDDHEQRTGCRDCDADDFIRPNGCYEDGPTHWMPLPHAPSPKRAEP